MESDHSITENRKLVTVEELDAEIDSGIVGIIRQLNNNGFKTKFCCSGLPSDHFDFPDKELTEQELEQVKKTAANAYISIQTDAVYNTENLDDLFYINEYPTWKHAMHREVPITYYIAMKYGDYQNNKPKMIGFFLDNMEYTSQFLNTDNFIIDDKPKVIHNLKSDFEIQEEFPVEELDGELYDLIEEYAVKYVSGDTIEETMDNETTSDQDSKPDGNKTSEQENESESTTEKSEDIDLEDVDLKNLVMNALPGHRLGAINLAYHHAMIKISFSVEVRKQIMNANSVGEIESIVQKEWDTLETQLEKYL